MTNKAELTKAWRDLPFLPVTFALPSQHAEFEAFATANPHLEWVRKSALHRGVQAVDPTDPSLRAGSKPELAQQLIRPFLIDR